MNSIITKLLSFMGIYNKLLSYIGFMFIIFVISFIAGYHSKSNQVNLATAKQDIKLATLQSKYDNVSATAQSDYLTMFNEVINKNESSNINNTTTKHDRMWNIFNRHRVAGEVSKNQCTQCFDAETTTRLENAKKNYIQLEFLQSYIRQIQELQ